jgi:hypothetical protein
MTAIANEIRELSGTTSTLGLDAMATNLSEANDEVSVQEGLLSQIIITLKSKVAGENVEVSLQEKTVVPTTSVQIVSPDDEYDGLSKVTV